MAALFADSNIIEYTGKLDKTTRVLTNVPMKDHFLITRTHHENPVLQLLYEGYKMAKNKSEWIMENRTALLKFNINLDAIPR